MCRCCTAAVALKPQTLTLHQLRVISVQEIEPVLHTQAGISCRTKNHAMVLTLSVPL